METLSVELKDIIATNTPKSDLPNLRLASKSLYTPATRELFSRIHVTPQAASFEKFHSILASPDLSKEVTYIKLTTSDDPYRDTVRHNDREIYSELTDEYREVIQSINRFPNLRDVALEFNHVCVYVAPDDYDKRDPEEGYEFRIEALSTFFEALNDPKNPTPNLRSLSIKNLQNWNDKDLMSSTNCKSTLAQISDLRLKIVTEYVTSSPESSWSMPELHNFFDELAETWLKPAEQNLISLTLHSDVFWGYIPKCDLRSIHFPNLTKLELGNWTFSNDWQVDWICSHTTLEILIMDDCAIVSHTQAYGPVDAEGYRADPTEMTGNYEPYRQDNRQRWSEIFNQIGAQLPNLRYFQFGSGDWQDGRNFDTTIGLLRLGMNSHAQTYTAFDRGNCPSPWINVQQYLDREREENNETRNGNERSPEPSETENEGQHMLEADHEDEAAYLRLMATVQAKA